MYRAFTTLVLLFGAWIGSFRIGGEELCRPVVAVQIAEVLANNRGLVADESGRFEDYIVLRNSSDAAVDLSGMYLSDDWDRPRRWRVPDGTSIAARSSIRIWADGRPQEGPLHATFKLDHDGERVLLFDTDARGNVMIDGIVFSRQLPDRPLRRDANERAVALLASVK